MSTSFPLVQLQTPLACILRWLAFCPSPFVRALRFSLIADTKVIGVTNLCKTFNVFNANPRYSVFSQNYSY